MSARHWCVGWMLCVAMLTPTGRAVSAEVPRPTLPPAIEPPPAPVSHLRIPIIVSTDAIETILAHELPETLRTDGWIPWSDGIEVRHEIARRRVEARSSFDRLEISLDLSMWLEGRGASFGEVSCGRSDGELTGTTGVVVRLAWEDDWRLAGVPTWTPTVLARRCKPTPPGIHFTPALSRASDLGFARRSHSVVDSLLRTNPEIHNKIEAVWQALQPARALGGERGWLDLQVEDLFAQPIDEVDGQFVAEAVAVVRPIVRPANLPREEIPLPPTNVRLRGDDFLVTFDELVSLSGIAQGLSRKFTGEVLEGETGATRLDGIEVFGGGDQVGLALRLAGAYEGTVYATGILEYDPETLTLFVGGLELTRESNRALFAGTDPRTRAALDALRIRLRDSLAFPLESRIATTLAVLGAALNTKIGNGISLSGGAMERVTLGVFVSADAVGVRLGAAGRLQARVD